jgi:OOP family OmpA-OmpF porin
MRELRTLAVGIVVTMAASGCALRDREWGSCAVAGGVLGAAVGGITGGVATNNAQDHPTDSERGAAIGGGIAAGALIGALLGHAVCDPVKAPPPPPPPPPPAQQPAPGTKLGTIGNAFFDFNRAEVKPGDGEDVLSNVVKTMKDNPGLKVLVEGHTDSVGSEDYNLRLSERRANAVRDYIVRQGVDAARITTRGAGEARPVASNDTAAGRAENRRAEVIAQ